MAVGPAGPTHNATVAQWLTTVQYPACPAQAGPRPRPIDPVTLAVQYWKTIPLPAPRPTIPPGYAITGKLAYLVTEGTVAPPEYAFNTPLGQLTIQASGAYLVNWGDPSAAGWSGPYPTEGQPWPNGRITHVYDNAATYTVNVVEQWRAVWHLAGATGTLNGLQTTATIRGFEARQYQAVITG
jgi:hypothetical protein